MAMNPMKAYQIMRKPVEEVTDLSLMNRSAHVIGRGIVVFTALNELGGHYCYGRGRNEADALKNLVEANFDLVTREVIEDQKYLCAHCGERAPLSGHHKEHRSKGRCDRKDNIEGLCIKCHGRQHGERGQL